MYKLSCHSSLALVSKEGKANKAYINRACVDGAYTDRACVDKACVNKAYMDGACADKAYTDRTVIIFG